MPRLSTTFILASAGFLALTVGAETANARIVCKGAFQIVQGQPIATPYCEDNNLAAVAREYGIQVSASSVRRSPSVKQRICADIGYDNRVSSACAGYRENPFLRRRF